MEGKTCNLIKLRKRRDTQDGKDQANDDKPSPRNKRYIFGTDNRIRISSSLRTTYPYRTVGIVGNHCTGTLVVPRHVITAGHCVHSGPGGDWIADLSFRPAYDEDAATKSPYGKFEWARAVTKTAWTRDGNWAWDYALIELSSSPGIGWMSFGWHSGLDEGWNFNLNGYPGSTLWGRMHHSYGSTYDVKSEVFKYREIDMVKGHSGGGVYLYDGASSRTIYGINNVQYWQSGDPKASNANYDAGHASPSWNQAVRITAYKFANICGWINDFASLGC